MDEIQKMRGHFLEIALKRVTDLVIITDADLDSPAGPRIVFVNKAVTSITGYSPEELIGQSPKIFQGPLTNRQTLDRIRSGLKLGIAMREELINYRKDGSDYWIEMAINSILDDAGEVTHFIAVEREVTEEKKLKEEAIFFKERFELAATATQDVIFDWDLEKGEIWNSASFRDVFGYDPISRFSLYDDDDVEFIKSSELMRFKEEVRKSIRNGASKFRGEFEFKKPDGSYGHAVTNGVFVYSREGEYKRLVGTTSDIVNYRSALESVNRSEQRFRRITDLLTDAVWEIDSEKGAIWLTPNWAGKLGIKITDGGSVHRALRIAIDPRERAQVMASFSEARRNGAGQWASEFQLIGTDGKKIEVAVKAEILRQPDGKVLQVIGNARNVTIENRQQEGFTRSRALEAVGQLTGGFAHDFNNLLMIIQGNAELLEMSDLPDDDAVSVKLISRATDSAAVLTSRLLSFSRQSQLQTEIIELAELIANTVALLKSGIPESILIHQIVPQGIWDTAVDGNALQQAIVNLAVNARDAMPNGGDITIGCENKVVSKDMEPYSLELEPGDYVVVSVSDNGEGMTPEVLLKVFEPFFTTKDVGKGTGLGLSTVYGFAKQSSGHAIVYSEPGQGTTIDLYLPRAKSNRNEEETKLSQKVAEVGVGQRILLVEDQPDVRAHVEKLLIRLGYSVTAVSNGQEALALLYRSEKFDLLFTDIVMPGGMNGHQLADEVGRLDSRMKVLFTSGYPAAAFDHLGLEEWGSLKLLRKPYRVEELKQVLSDIFTS